MPSRAADDEVLRAGPTCWGTVLQLPDSWVEAVSTAQLPEEQPLRTALEVGLPLATQASMLMCVSMLLLCSQHKSTVQHTALRSVAGCLGWLLKTLLMCQHSDTACSNTSVSVLLPCACDIAGARGPSSIQNLPGHPSRAG